MCSAVWGWRRARNRDTQEPSDKPTQQMAHNLNPVEGKCNARYKDGSGYCANGPHNPNSLTNKRCKFHGGLSSGPTSAEGKAKNGLNAVKHGLYAKRLRDSFKKPEDRALWDQMPTDTDLTNEILLCRMRVEKYQTLLEDGTEEIPGYVSRVTGEVCYHSVHDLLAKSLDQLRLMTESQQRMHPEAGTKGDMTITVSLNTGNKDIADEDVPDLDADGVKHDAVLGDVNPIDDEEPEDTSPLAGIDDD